MFFYVITIWILWLSVFDFTLSDLTEDQSDCLVPTGNIKLREFFTDKPLEPGTLAPARINIIYSCPESYILNDIFRFNYCTDKAPIKWFYKHPECVKFCAPIQSYSIEANCEYEGQIVSCRENVISNTTARLSCPLLYEKPNSNQLYETIHCQNNGTWDHSPFKCEQMCNGVGRANPNYFNPHFKIRDHNLRKPIEVPWHINIYSIANSEKYQYICGGALIQAKIVISAAHCFWNDEKSVPYDKSKFIVTAGKFNRDYYSDKETFEVQRASLFKIDIPAIFRGSQNDFEGDIAILTLNNYIKLRTHIIPICVPWTMSNGKFQSVVGGMVIGLGTVDVETNYPLLRSVFMEGLDTENCRMNKLIENYNISDDQFCGYSSAKGETICKGDGGGAYVVSRGGTPLFLGVFSHIAMTNTSDSECDEKLLRIFTSFYPYEAFIKNIIDNVSDDDNEILAIDEPENGTFSNTPIQCFIPTDNIILTDTITKMKLEPGTTITEYMFVNYSCPAEYVLDGEKTNYCNGRRWKKMHPKCIKTCSPIQGYTIRAYYYYDGDIIKNQTYYKPGTTAIVKCATMYRKSRQYLVANEDLHCQADGEWDYEPFQCEQICGTLDTNVPFSVNSTLTEPSKVPWHIGLYFKKDEKYELICGGTIIRSKVIVTVAHCFWDPAGKTLEDASKFMIATGKFYRDYYADNEMLKIQKINVSKIDIPITFLGANYDWANDIAVLTLSDHIVFKSYVRPACLTWKELSGQYMQSDVPGIVAGWGVTENGTYSTQLRSVELLSIDNHTCKKEKIRKNNDIATDKFCVETGNGKNVCQGDSGGGFVAPTEINNEIYYNFWGVVSNGIIPRGEFEPKCNSKFVTTFTNVQYYRRLVDDVISKAYQ